MLREKPVNKRFIVYSAFTLLIVFVLSLRLFMVQIVNGEKYLKEAEKKSVRNVVIPAPRGEIVDRFGNPLVTNKMGYAVQIQRTNIYNKEFDDILLKTYKLLKEKNQEVEEELPISFYPYEFTFKEKYEDEERAKKAESEWKEKWDIDSSLSAKETLYELKERYKIENGYTEDEIRMIVGVRYDMVLKNFSVSLPYTMAENIDMEILTIIKENESEYPCVSVVAKYERQFPNGQLAAHILGRTGQISGEEYEAMKNDGYKLTDHIGKQGIEKVCENYLRGVDGVAGFVQTSDGFKENPDARVEAIPGNYAVLTIDSKMQEVLENSLESTILGIRERGDGYKNAGGDAAGGAAVVLDVNSGEVLAIASYPTYDPNFYNENYTKLAENKFNPMWNRAIGGAYAPGSTFKMLTSIAALEEGVITPSTVIEDEGVYKFYDDYQPKCWIYTRNGTTHGPTTVASALENSCNYFYYETGRLLGIEKLNKYQKMFGLGEKSGIELSLEESKGTVAGPEERERIGGRKWSGGDTIQASIGQSDNLITPIQLANYVATLVNGGKRYMPHIIKEIRSPETGKIIKTVKPEIIEDLDIDEKNLKAVMKGMLGVTQDGTASSVFENYPVAVGGKTGSAQVATGSDNGVFVAFAPYDDPQIAIAIVVEHGNSGGDVAPVARSIFNYYFGISDNEEETPRPNKYVPSMTLRR